ncbi:hypothetical protein HSB1_43330 [Halogranum salarium B-1]|uniref:Uncharacterized protein n=1 Tax=Halogranum salarium B-1 TaxID=1210908 RepID=J2Z9Q3_9EURY|nr:hypothetical protein HSB1_43330 [Halogranum salarium B-1]
MLALKIDRESVLEVSVRPTNRSAVLSVLEVVPTFEIPNGLLEVHGAYVNKWFDEV